MNIIGLCGFAGSGKSTVANYLVDHHNFQRMSFATALKDVVASLFCWDRELVEGKTADARTWREQPDPFWSTVMGEPWTARRALQFVGTDVMRNHLHKNIWVERVKRELQLLPESANVVFDDVRFVNEIDTLRSCGATIMVMNRPDIMTHEHHRLWNLAFDPTMISRVQFTSDLHPSETEWLLDPQLKTTQILSNTAGINELLASISTIIPIS